MQSLGLKIGKQYKKAAFVNFFQPPCAITQPAFFSLLLLAVSGRSDGRKRPYGLFLLFVLIFMLGSMGWGRGMLLLVQPWEWGAGVGAQGSPGWCTSVLGQLEASKLMGGLFGSEMGLGLVSPT